MGTANIIFKRTILLLAIVMLAVLSCRRSDDELHDIQSPQLSVSSPKEGQVFQNGDTIIIVAKVSDNNLLHEYAWGIYDTAGTVVDSHYLLAHGKKQDTITSIHIVSGITTTSLWTMWLHLDDEEHNGDGDEINIIVNP